jgi:hypothetical protein
MRAPIACVYASGYLGWGASIRLFFTAGCPRRACWHQSEGDAGRRCRPGRGCACRRAGGAGRAAQPAPSRAEIIAAASTPSRAH